MKIVERILGVELRACGWQFRWSCFACNLWGPVGQAEDDCRAAAIAHAETVHGGEAPTGPTRYAVRGRAHLGGRTR